MKLKNQLKRRREKAGLTQVQIAKKVGISEVSYQRIEYGSQRPSLRTAIRIADVLGVKDLRLLWGGNPTK